MSRNTLIDIVGEAVVGDIVGEVGDIVGEAVVGDGVVGDGDGDGVGDAVVGDGVVVGGTLGAGDDVGAALSMTSSTKKAVAPPRASPFW